MKNDICCNNVFNVVTKMRVPRSQCICDASCARVVKTIHTGESSCGKWNEMNSTFLMVFACAKLENTSELYTNGCSSAS